MPYRNKTYIAFDADSDIHYYRLMQAWKQSDYTTFNFADAHDLNTIRSWSTEESKKNALRLRMLNSMVFVLLIGEKTKFQNTYVRWEIEQAIKQNIPIIGVNLNGRRSMDDNRCPLILRDQLAIHVTFNAAIIQFALENWSTWHFLHKSQGAAGPFFYADNIYQGLGL
jgi:hypothetical protein